MAKYWQNNISSNPNSDFVLEEYGWMVFDNWEFHWAALEGHGEPETERMLIETQC